MSLCITTAGVTLALALETFTLAWTHSVERTRWEEDWRVMPTGLVIEEARIEGSGAGMEIPADARLVDGFWVYRPRLAPQEKVHLIDAGRGADWDICSAGICLPLASLVPASASQFTLSLCPAGVTPKTWDRLANERSGLERD